jgi:hypothetical protein
VPQGDIDADGDGNASPEEFDDFVHEMFDRTSMKVKAYDKLHKEK